MPFINPAFEAFQRRRFTRPDAARWLRKDINKREKSFAEERNAEIEPLLSLAGKDVECRTATQVISARHRAHLDSLSLRGAAIGFRLRCLLRKALPPDGGVAAEGPLHYLTQPRVPRGNTGGGQWTRVAGGARGRGSIGNLPGHSLGQEARLAAAMTRTERALHEIRRYEPDWKPRAPSLSAPGSLDGAIGDAEARAIEAEMHLSRLRSGFGGNFGPPLESVTPLSSRGASFDAEGWIGAYRTVNNMPDLFGRPSWPSDRGTVAVTRVDSDVVFGVNSGAPTYTSSNYRDAVSLRDTLVEKYPTSMNLENIGGAPNDSVFHAETTLLLNAARNGGGTLAGRDIEIYTDRPVCDASCREVLPKVGLELGNPIVTFVNPNGVRNTMWNGAWMGEFKR